MRNLHPLTVSLTMMLAPIFIGSAGAEDCAAAPVHSSNGTYTQCEVVHGADVQFRTVEDVPEAGCNSPTICSAFTEMDEMAKESRDLDISAGLAD